MIKLVSYIGLLVYNVKCRNLYDHLYKEGYYGKKEHIYAMAT